MAASAHADLLWANKSTATIGRSTLTGGSADQSFLGTSSLGGGIAIDASHIYWADVSGFVGRADIDGTDRDDGWIVADSDNVLSVAVDSQHVYWTYANSPKIGQANRDGTYLYWADPAVQEIDRITLAGTNGQRAVHPPEPGRPGRPAQADGRRQTATDGRPGGVGTAPPT